MHISTDRRAVVTAPTDPTAKTLPAVPIPTRTTGRVAVANCITGPTSFTDWIATSFLTTYTTLGTVGGVTEFCLRRQTLAPGSDHCLFLSYTVWDHLEAFEQWRTSAAFVAAHPDRTDYHAEFQRMQSIRYDIPLGAETPLTKAHAQVLARLRAEHPALVTTGEFTDDIHWAAPAAPVLAG